MDEDRKRGRPRVANEAVRVNVTVAASEYDRLYQLARAQDTSVPAVIRLAISVLKNTTAA
jgi:hypothetical protein